MMDNAVRDGHSSADDAQARDGHRGKPTTTTKASRIMAAEPKPTDTVRNGEPTVPLAPNPDNLPSHSGRVPTHGLSTRRRIKGCSLQSTRSPFVVTSTRAQMASPGAVRGALSLLFRDQSFAGGIHSNPGQPAQSDGIRLRP